MVQRLLMANLFAAAPTRLGNDLTLGIGRLEAWLAAEPSNCPRKMRRGSPAPPASKTWNFRLEDPELSTRKTGVTLQLLAENSSGCSREPSLSRSFP
jgi:hypothetical protein